MRRYFFLMIMCFCVAVANAAYLRNIPMTVTQPDGTTLQCFASGDEFFNYLHDANGYTIMRHPHTGYYVYAQKRDGKLVATEFVAGRQDPASVGLQPYALISPEEWMAKRKAWEVPDVRPQNRDFEPNHGTLNNIGVFIRFSDDAQLSNSYASIDNMFNDVSEGAVSMKSYFRAASYGAIEIPTTFYPGHNGDAIISYQDTYPRSYFEPYNEYSNPNGYQDDDERTEREFSLLERTVNYINANYPIPTDLNIDYDEDGYVDNVCFIVKGGVGEWSSLLWPHKWSLYGKNVYINEKRVWTFNFQLADASSYFNTSVMCHEMNHSLGAPDLYHYYHGTDLSPVGRWDLMESNATPPQHCGAYMKMKYGHWIDEIPEITEAGVYTLNPISSATPTNIAYKIQSDNPYQYYVLEYRDNTVETALPGRGLLIYRINTYFDGNAGYNPEEGIYDEVYLFRPGGYVSDNGNVNSAYFSAGSGRTEFNATSNPYPFYTDGTIDHNFMIYNITEAGNTISFAYGSSSACEAPVNLALSTESNNVTLTWNAASGAASYNIYRNGVLKGNTSGTSFVDSNLDYGIYTYFLRSVDANGLLSLSSEEVSTTFVPESSIIIGDGVSTTNECLPSYTYYNYGLTQQIYTANEIGTAGIITSIAFYNAGEYKTRNYTFYLKNTSKTSFSGPTDWVSVTDDDRVYQGPVTMSAGMWTVIHFDTPFNYDGTSNVVLVTDDNTGSWSYAPHMSCIVFEANNQAIRIYDDNANLNPYSPYEYEGTVLSVKNQIIMKVESTLETFDITASANPVEGGTVTGDGPHFNGQTCHLSATAATGYYFVKWTKDGELVSTSAEYSFIATEPGDYVAHFNKRHYQISASANPSGSGTIIGAGSYEYGETAELKAVPNDGYRFVKWTQGSTVVSTDSIYSFVVTANGTYKAHFEVVDGVNESNTAVSIFPNPTENVLNITADNITSIRLVDLQGKIVYESVSGDNNVLLDMTGFANGQYLLQINTEKGSSLHKVVKK